MRVRKETLRETAGVKLQRIEELSASQKVVSTHYRLSTLRPNQPRILADEDSAGEAFDLEVIASLLDPIVSTLVDGRS